MLLVDLFRKNERKSDRRESSYSPIFLCLSPSNWLDVDFFFFTVVAGGAATARRVTTSQFLSTLAGNKSPWYRRSSNATGLVEA
jgi:hypothetical protein